MKSTYRLLLVTLPLTFLAVFYFFPLSRIFFVSLSGEQEFGPGIFHRLTGTGIYAKVLWFTTWQAAVSTMLTLLLALPGTYVFARYRFPGKKLLRAFTTVPFVLPTVVVAAAFQSLLGADGLINKGLMTVLGLNTPVIRMDQSIWFILLAHVFYNYTVILRIVGSFWANLEPAMADAARMLGASSWQVFWKITLPLLRPALLAAGLLVFVFCFSSFGVILILGGPRMATIEVEIYRQAVHLFNLPMAAALSLIQIIFTFGLMWIYTWLQKKSSVPLNPDFRAATRLFTTSPKDRLIVWGNLALMLILLGLPLIALVASSFLTDSGFSGLYYTALFDNKDQSLFFVPPLDAVVNSVGFALTTLMIALILGTLAAAFLSGPKDRLASILDPVFMLPLSTSAVTLGFGFIIALDKPPLNLRTSLMLVPLAHALVAFPFVVRSLLPAMRSIPDNLREAAALLGASPRKVWQSVDLPIIGRALVVGAVFAFTVSLGEFGATMFVARPQTPTMPLAIYRFLGQPGSINYGQAMAMSSILMFVTAAGFLLLEKFRTGSGEF